MQLAGIVETNVRYHSNQRIADQFIAENVFKIINHKNVVILGLTEMTEVLDTVEILVEVLDTVEVLGLTEVQTVTNAQKCTMQFVVIAETNVRYHSNQRIADQFIAENVFKITNHKNLVFLGLTEMTEVLDTVEILVEVLDTAEILVEVLDTAEILAVSLKKIEPQFMAETVLEKMNINQKI